MSPRPPSRSAHKLRSVLTTLGIIIGVMSVIAVVSLLQGFGNALSTNFKGMGSNTILVTSYLSRNDQLAGKNFFLGQSFTMADASLYHPLFFLALNPSNFSMVNDFKNVSRWYERIRDIA